MKWWVFLWLLSIDNLYKADYGRYMYVLFLTTKTFHNFMSAGVRNWGLIPSLSHYHLATPTSLMPHAHGKMEAQGPPSHTCNICTRNSREGYYLLVCVHRGRRHQLVASSPVPQLSFITLRRTRASSWNVGKIICDLLYQVKLSRREPFIIM